VAAFWVPLRVEPVVRVRRTEFIARAIGRLAPGVAIDDARAEVAVLADAMSAEHPELRGMHAVIAPLGEDQFAAVRPLLISLLAAVALVLLIACLNIANLLVVRAATRQREIAVRYAMGASRRRVIGELLVESVILGLSSAALALALGAWTTSLLVSLAPASMPRIAEASFDLPSFAVTAALGLTIGLIFGVLPAFQVSRAQPTDVLKATDRRAGGGWLAGSRRVLLAVEVALSIVLLIGAGLMVRSLAALNDVDLGFDPAGVVNATIPLPERVYPTQAARHAFFERVAERAAAIPGVTAVAFANAFPMRGGWTSGFVMDPIGGEPPITNSAGFQAVSPGFFTTLGIRLVRGRLLQPGDRETSEPVAMVSASFGPALLDGADPIGRQLRRGPQAPAIRIVGVVTDIRRGGRTTNLEPQVYLAAAQTSIYPTRLAELAVRVSGDAPAVASALRQAVLGVNPAQPVINVRTLDETLFLRQAERQFQTMLLALFAALALVLAVTGVYSLAAYVVSQRTSEIGLRIALGANPGRILAWVVGQSIWPIGAGALVGLGAAALLSDTVSSLLFNTSPLDSTTYLGAAVVLFAAALAAVALAGRRAMQVDPVSVLK
jgi:putative ABC transport system permease protein